jgi:hypothetical protein
VIAQTLPSGRIVTRRVPQPSAAVERAGLRFAVLGFLALHVILGPVIGRDPNLAKWHAYATLGVGIWWAWSPQTVARVPYVAAYIVGAELIWRMAGAPIFWEYGKQALTAVLLFALLRHGRFKPAASPLAVLYFLLLVPSSILTVMATDFWTAKDDLSFYLSGPLALAIGVLFFSQFPVTGSRLCGVLVGLVAPILSISTIVLLGVLDSPNLRFGTESLPAASGNFAANQVSAILGLGCLAALFLLLDDLEAYLFRLLMFGVMIVLAMQSALTFSRGGLFNTAGAILVGGLFLIRQGRTRLRVFLVGALLLLVAQYVVLPRLDDLTGGAIFARFSSADSTGRDRLVWADFEVWNEHLWFGVGPGQAAELRTQSANWAAAHTEFTRMLSEHGMLGLASVLALVALMIRRVYKAQTVKERALIAASFTWACLFMMNAAMRLAAPSFMIGLACSPALWDAVIVERTPRRRDLRQALPRRPLEEVLTP